MTYVDAIEWIESHYEFDEFDSFSDFIEEVRGEFQNDNLITQIEDELIMIYDSSSN